jgi:hypothetical protein
MSCSGSPQPVSTSIQLSILCFDLPGKISDFMTILAILPGPVMHTNLLPIDHDGAAFAVA